MVNQQQQMILLFLLEQRKFMKLAAEAVMPLKENNFLI
jgi:hypothetical protein